MGKIMHEKYHASFNYSVKNVSKISGTYIQSFLPIHGGFFVACIGLHYGRYLNVFS